jgi:hypothetical protein
VVDGPDFACLAWTKRECDLGDAWTSSDAQRAALLTDTRFHEKDATGGAGRTVVSLGGWPDDFEFVLRRAVGEARRRVSS